MDIVEGLNAEQKRAATYGSGPLAIIAGPGTGKTRTLTARIAWLLRHNLAGPEQILAITFTHKAAQEIAERVCQATGQSAVQATTFHAWCHALLIAQGNTRQFIAESERAAIIRDLAGSPEAKQLPGRELSLLISRHKNTVEATLPPFVAAYNKRLRALELRDFDDLLVDARALLDTDTTVRAEVQNRYKYVLIDEFQDTNELQYRLIQLLAGTDNIAVIGDPLQSIYGFRQATGDMFARFRADFKAKTITLQTNYRSAKQVVGLARATFPQLALRAQSAEDGNVRIVQTLNEYAEADYIIRAIEARMGGTTLLGAVHTTDRPGQFSDFAIIYRTRRSAQMIQRRLSESGLPFQVVGEDSPYAHPTIQAIVLLLELLEGDQPVAQRDLRLHSLLKKQWPHIEAFIKAGRALLMDKDVVQIVDACIAQCGLESALQKIPTIRRQFMNLLVQFQKLPLRTAIQQLRRLQQADFYNPRANVITLLTIHAAKGLEFDHVFICGVEEGLLPHGREGTDIAEEKRLFYVATTRAKSHLTVLYAKKRAGQSTTASRFIKNLADFPILSDEAMPAQEKRLQKRVAKKRQASLF